MVTSIKGSEGLRLEDDRPGSEPLRPSVRQVTPKPPSEPFRNRHFLVRYEDIALGKVTQPASMISMQVGKDDGPHVVGANTELEQLRADLLFRGHIELDRQAEVRVPSRDVTRFTSSSGLTRVHNDDAFGSLDRPSVDREGFGPRAVEQDVELTQRSSAPPDRLADLYPHSSSLDGVDLQRGYPPMLFGLHVDLVPQPAVDQAKGSTSVGLRIHWPHVPSEHQTLDIISLSHGPVRLTEESLMGIEASYHRINAAAWDQLQQLQESSPTLTVTWQPESDEFEEVLLAIGTEHRDWIKGLRSLHRLVQEPMLEQNGAILCEPLFWYESDGRRFACFPKAKPPRQRIENALEDAGVVILEPDKKD
jgi:hypothetical protein